MARRVKKSMAGYRVIHGDCLLEMAKLDECSVDSIVTDPPYGLNFMGKEWDRGVPGVAYWQQALMTLKPGGHLLAFGGTRTYHRMACAIEDAGFEIRDCIQWIYGTGFPKSLDISKAIDKAAGVEREVVGSKVGLPGYSLKHQGVGGILSGRADGSLDNSEGECSITAPATDAARQWDGWGTALKPACEIVVMARKPLSEKTVAANVLEHGTGGINVDACRVGTDGRPKREVHPLRDDVVYHPNTFDGGVKGSLGSSKAVGTTTQGRWPSNLIHDGSEEVLAGFPESNGSGRARILKRGTRDDGWGMADTPGELCDAGSGSAARFFYCAKASKSERGDGNFHPTVKPLALMRYLVRLVTPPGGIVLDPFAGSGSTGVAGLREGFGVICIDNDPVSVETTMVRLKAERR